MKKLRFLTLLLVLILALAACGPDTSVNTAVSPTDGPSIEDAAPNAGGEEQDANDEVPISAPSVQVYEQIEGEPGFVATFGEQLPEPWHPGIAVFNDDGSIVAHIGTDIRLYDTATFALVQTLPNLYPQKCAQEAAFDTDGEFFAISFAACGNQNETAHILLYDLAAGQVAKDWALESAAMSDDIYGEFSIPVSAMAFIPSTPKLAYANGNTVVIQNVLTDTEPEIIELDDNMYASQLSVRDDGEYLFVLMTWQKTVDGGASLLVTPRLQSWHLPSLSLNVNRWMDDMVNPGEYMLLVEDYLVHGDPFNAALYGLSLQDETEDEFPYRDGQTFFSSDMRYMVFFRGSGTYNETLVWDNVQGVEIDSFNLDIPAGWDKGVSDFVFSPDNSLIAIEHNGQLTLYSIASLVVVEEAQP